MADEFQEGYRRGYLGEVAATRAGGETIVLRERPGA